MPATQAHEDEIHAAISEVTTAQAALAAAESKLAAALSSASTAAGLTEGDIVSLGGSTPAIFIKGGTPNLIDLPTLATFGK